MYAASDGTENSARKVGSSQILAKHACISRRRNVIKLLTIGM
jgi:hypothetical protein